MRWKLPSGKLTWKSDKQYLINWDKPAKSKLSQHIQDFLKQNACNYIWYAEYRIPSTRLKVDYLCPNLKIAIEAQGAQHEKYVKFFQKSRIGYLNQIKRDIKKEKFLTENGYTLILIYEKDIPITKDFFTQNYNVHL